MAPMQSVAPVTTSRPASQVEVPSAVTTVCGGDFHERWPGVHSAPSWWVRN
jgi:hypothetical protein